jgi:hypothetical protein
LMSVKDAGHGTAPKKIARPLELRHELPVTVGSKVSYSLKHSNGKSSFCTTPSFSRRLPGAVFFYLKERLQPRSGNGSSRDHTDRRSGFSRDAVRSGTAPEPRARQAGKAAAHGSVPSRPPAGYGRFRMAVARVAASYRVWAISHTHLNSGNPRALDRRAGGGRLRPLYSPAGIG